MIVRSSVENHPIPNIMKTLRASLFRWGVPGLLLLTVLPGMGQDDIIAHWDFETIDGHMTLENVSGELHEIRGNFWIEKGVLGKCLKLDGYTTHLACGTGQDPQVEGDFTIEAWVAPQTYPWNWTAIVNQERDHQRGFFFGISAEGNVGLAVAAVADGQWIPCITKGRIDPLRWSHVAATFDESFHMAVYINGKKSAEFSPEEFGWDEMYGMREAKDIELWLGRSHARMYPKGTERPPSRAELSVMVFDGLIDEVKIYNSVFSEEEVQKAYERVQPENPQPLTWRRFPTEGSEKRTFGASYTRLTYDETWDKSWRIGEHSDVVVTFEDPVRMVFWHGINYAATLVTENEIWMGDQSLECGSAWGCNEHMSDKQCRYAHVRIIENNPARVVIHWRYALADILYQIPNRNQETGWGDWADEYFVIYPDVVSVRHQILWSDNFGVALNTANWIEGQPWHQFQETILFNQPGTWPRDNVEMKALTVATMDGETFTCEWGEGIDVDEEELVELEVFKNANIQMTNLRSEYRPFTIFEPGSVIAPWVEEDLTFWNHWPVAQLPSDGRYAPHNDRPSHTSLSCGAPLVHEGQGNSREAVMLYGLLNAPIEELVPLARSWNLAPDIRVTRGKATSLGYDKFQRAYLLQCDPGESSLECKWKASPDQPLVNPVLVCKNWGRIPAAVRINGKEAQSGTDYRVGYEHKLEGTDLVLWINRQTETDFTVDLMYQKTENL